MSKYYDVSLPITGVIIVTVEADSEDEAVQKAFESDQLVLDNIESWSPHEKIVEGNIFHGERNDVDVDLAHGEEEQ